eukprot:c28255_g1_i1 orf=268-2082(+)
MEVQVQCRQNDLASNSPEMVFNMIRDTEPASWLAAPSELVEFTRIASGILFSLTSAYTPSCPLRKLLTNQFDAEQIWQQIDLQCRPLVSSLGRRIREIERNTDMSLLCKAEPSRVQQVISNVRDNLANVSTEAVQKNSQGTDTERAMPSDKKVSGEEGRDGIALPLINESCEPTVGDKFLEDRFLKLSEMETFLDKAEAEDTGQVDSMERDLNDRRFAYGEDDSDDRDDYDDIQMDGGLNLPANVEKDVGSDDGLFRYDDFFGGGGKGHDSRALENTSEKFKELPSDMDEDAAAFGDLQQMESMSTHERKLQKIHKQIEQLEKANLETKFWTMQGEVSAAKRPKNSALEVELDFEHNARPPPVITEEVTASLEDIIRSRIAEERFDDIQRKPSLPTSAPQEQIKLDESKSKKGLGELYEAEFMQTVGLTRAPLSASDALRKEADMLFKALCIRLDALSHFHFAPKPVIEDMTLQLDVPALAMEEVAPLAVSDAHMLAPEEVFAGHGVLKDDKELNQLERKRRRAKMKRKIKAKKSHLEVEKGQQQSQEENRGDMIAQRPKKQQRILKSEYGKSAKVFAELDKAKVQIIRPARKVATPLPSFLKL